MARTLDSMFRDIERSKAPDHAIVTADSQATRTRAIVASYIVTPWAHTAMYSTLDGAIAAAKERAAEDSGRVLIVAMVICSVKEVTSKSIEVTQASLNHEL